MKIRRATKTTRSAARRRARRAELRKVHRTSAKRRARRADERKPRKIRPPMLRAWTGDEEGIDIDLFAGGGGASEGKRRATGRSPDIAVNHWPAAIAMHEVNHPDCDHYVENVYKVKPLAVTKGKRCRLLWASPTCFPAGTLVLTRNGLQPVELVAVGDEVLTHKSRWRKVVSTISKKSPTVIVRGQGHYGLETTPDHPFYSKRITRRYPRGRDGRGMRHRPVREMNENPYWPTAETMEGKLWASPTRFAECSIPICQTASFSDDFFYLVGRWVGDGFGSKGDVVICTGASDFNAMRAIFRKRPLLDQSGRIVAPRVDATDSPAPKLIWGNSALSRWLEDNFGAGCENKHLPSWVFSMQESWRRALLDGYVDADGYTKERFTSTTSVSKALSVGVRLLVASLGYAPCMYFVSGKPGQIEGRHFIGRDSFKVDWRTDNQKETSLRDTAHLFTLVKEVTDTGRIATVYCLQVDEDESYVADGIVVHNCSHFSRASGCKLKDRKIRGLAWSIIPWIKHVRPDLIILENVVEFLTWGPLHDEHRKRCKGDSNRDGCHKTCPYGKPIKDRMGETFAAFKDKVESYGYSFEFKILTAYEFGAPTTRTRVYIQMRADGLPATWPEPTHAKPTLAFDGENVVRIEADGKRMLQPWRTAAEVIDWSIPCRSIFDRKVPHVPATRRRLAKGVRKFVLETAKPFLLHLTHGDRHAPHSIDEPVPTVTCANRGEQALAVPYMIHMGNGERPGQEPRTYDVGKPYPTVVAGGIKAQPVVARLAFMAKAYGERRETEVQAQALDQPLSTVTTQDHHQLVAAHTVKFQGTSTGSPLHDPLHTVTAGGEHHGIVAASLMRYNGERRDGESPRGQSLDAPISTLDTSNRFALVNAHAAQATEWNDVIAAKARRVYKFLKKEGHDGPWMDHANKIVRVPGTDLVIYDIAMRMLIARELFRANGFADSYVIDLIGPNGKPLTKTEQIRMVGNSVVPHVAEALVRAALSSMPKRQAPRRGTQLSMLQAA